MSVRAYFQTPYDVELFVESAPGVFDVHISENAYLSQRVDSSADSMTVVAVSNSASATVVRGWSRWQGAMSGYPDGPVLKVQGTAGSSSGYNKPGGSGYGFNGCKVTVIDDYGKHIGTPVMSKENVVSTNYPCGAVAVKHVSSNDPDRVFYGWRVTRKPYLYSRTMDYLEVLSAAPGVTDGLVTLYSEASLGGSALVIKIPEDVDSGQDELVIEAVYVDNLCTISFALNSDDASGPAIPDIKVAFGTSARLPTPAYWVRPGYVFAGWNTAADGSGESYEADALYTGVDGVYLVTMYAQWAKTGGEGAQYGWSHDRSGNYPSFNYTYPYRLDVSVAGVGDAEVGIVCQTRTKIGSRSYTQNIDTGAVSNEMSSEQGPTVNVRYPVPAAVSVPDVSYISYSYVSQAYGVSSSSKGSRSYTRYWADDDKSWIWEAPELDGLDFVGWYTIAEAQRPAGSVSAPSADSLDFTVLVTTDRVTTWGVLRAGLNYVRTLYSNNSTAATSVASYVNYLRLVYRGKRLRVRFEANGGELYDYVREVRYGETYGDMPVPERYGYEFKGWYTERDGGELVTPESIVAVKVDHRLYAHWERVPVTVTVHFVPCGGTVEVESMQVTSGSAYGVLPVPVRDGYEFLGWFTASLGGSAVTADTVVGRTYMHWLYAQWSKVGGDDPLPSGGSAYLFDVI